MSVATSSTDFGCCVVGPLLRISNQPTMEEAVVEDSSKYRCAEENKSTCGGVRFFLKFMYFSTRAEPYKITVFKELLIHRLESCLLRGEALSLIADFLFKKGRKKNTTNFLHETADTYVDTVYVLTHLPTEEELQTIHGSLVHLRYSRAVWPVRAGSLSVVVSRRVLYKYLLREEKSTHSTC